MDVVIHFADKGNATVLMTKEDFDTKMKGLLETAIYRQLGWTSLPLMRVLKDTSL